MIEIKMKSGILWSCLSVLALVSLAGCKSPPDETWHCYDEHINPLDGVVIVCDYGLVGYNKSAVNYRVSDGTGKMVLDLDNDTPSGLIRSISCIYSTKTKGGCIGEGKRWHLGAEIPRDSVFFDEYEKNIYIKSGIDDPIIWATALNALIDQYRRISAPRTKDFSAGNAKHELQISELIPKERIQFLEKYGDQLVPLEEIEKREKEAGLFFFRRYLPEGDRTGLKFKDVILSMPKP